MGNHLVIAGHGKRRNGSFDSGATGLITKGEHRYVKEDLFPAMRKHLPKNHNVVFFDKYNVYSHGNIVALARQYKADQITEIHYDAGASSASGGHVIIHSGYKPDKTDLAFRDAIDKMVGVRYTHKGYKGISGRNNLANVNRTANAGITYRMLELGFGTNRRDAKIMTEQVDAYARELVKAITGKAVKGASQGGLNVSQYNELKNLIGSLQNQVTTLRKELDNKEGARKEREVSASHKKAWDWLVSENITNGSNPQNYVTREQLATMLYSYYESNEKLPDWMYDSILDVFEGIEPYLKKPDEWREKIKNKDADVNELLGVFLLAFLNKNTG